MFRFGAVILLAANLAFAQTPPVAARKPHVTEAHGETRSDDYFWLRDKENPEVLEHLKAENAYTTAVLKPTEALQQKLYDELLSRTKETDLTLPNRLNGYDYYSRTEAGKQYPIRARRKVPNGPEEITLDPNELAKGNDYLDLGAHTS